MENKGEIRYIVRIAGKDLDGNLPIYRAITKIKGISHRVAKMIANAFEKENNVSYESTLGSIDESLDKKLEDIVINPTEHGLPSWSVNRQKDRETGETRHLVMADLDFSIRQDLQRLNEIKSYRGLRHSWGLPVRGQRTKSTHRGKGSVVGVIKKEVKK